ncbi:MAG: hypothetical protein EXQ69_04925 [Acidimicrobiia bacterium]|nr:hypothetical protein [Acidimicrobiia bacterium]
MSNKVSAFGIVLFVIATACGTGTNNAASSTTTPTSQVQWTIEPGAVLIETAGPSGNLSDIDRDAVIETVRNYISAATVDPLLTGSAGDLAPLLTAAAASSLDATDRDALLDEGLPKATGPIQVVAVPIKLTALVDKDGVIDLVGALLEVTVSAETDSGPVQVHRGGDLLLRREGLAWRIESFRLVVGRTGKGVPTPTTSRTGPPTSTKQRNQP